MRGKTPPNEPLTSAERRNLRIVAAATMAALAVGVTVWELAGPSSVSFDKSSGGCVNVKVVGTTGGGLEHECGAAAQTWCAAAFQQHDDMSVQVQRQCDLAGVARKP